MKIISSIFFYTYVGLVLVAGFWGAFINPYFDFKFLFNADVHSLPDSFRINLLDQYRFLRALELGFGVFSIMFRVQIFNIVNYNRLFLFIMGSGILARLFSFCIDGRPNTLGLFFFLYEVIGIIFIFIYTRNNIIAHGSIVS